MARRRTTRIKQSYAPSDEKICQCGNTYTKEAWRMLPHPDPEMKSGVGLMICGQNCEAVPPSYHVEKILTGYPWAMDRSEQPDVLYPTALVYHERNERAREIREAEEADAA